MATVKLAPNIVEVLARIGIKASDIDDATAHVLSSMHDPRWRLRNLYHVRDKDGQIVPFRPWPEQEKFYNDLWYRNLVPKARQRGFSTAVQLMIFDACIFVDNTAGAIVAQDLPTAIKIYDDKINIAWKSLPEIIRALNPRVVDNKQESQWANGSSLIVSTSTRGTTLQYLHVSELGRIDATNPQKATEIQTGALPSVGPNGIAVVESTVESPTGVFADMVREALKVKKSGRPLTRRDYRVHFASWWDAPEYEADPTHIAISPKEHAYFDKMEQEIGVTLTPRKRAWWILTRDSDFGGDEEKMWSQYPTTIDEAFRISGKTQFLGSQLNLARKEHRILPMLPYDPSIPVDLYFDLGTSDNTAIWFAQERGSFTDWIDFLEESGEPPSFFARALLQHERKYNYGMVWLPHDGAHLKPQTASLKSYRDMYYELGIRNIDIVPRIDVYETGVDLLRQAFGTYRFDETRCKEGLAHLEDYRKTLNSQGVPTSRPLQNGHQHAADALRQHAQVRHYRRGVMTGSPSHRRPTGKIA